MHDTFSHLPVLLRVSGEASVLILLVLAAQWLCGQRLKPRWRYALWLLVLLRLASPLTLPSPVSLFNVLRLPAAAQPVAEQPTPVATINATVADAHRPANAVSFPQRQLACMAVGCRRLFRGGLRLGEPIQVPSPAGKTASVDGRTHARFARRLQGALGRRRARVADRDGRHRMSGRFWLRASAYPLAQGVAVGFHAGELRHVFLHELAHIKRHDILAGWVALALQIVHWFNPMVWLAFYRLRADRELACDALALSCAQTGENEPYGLTMVKLLEGFGRAAWRPGVAGILEKKQQMKRRISMIAKYHKADRGLTLAVVLLTGLALVTLTDAQNGTRLEAPKVVSPQIGPPDAAKGVWVVRFEPAGDFSPKTPGEFLSKIHVYSGQEGEIGYFRTTKQGNKLVGSFLAYDGDQLKAALSKIPELKVTSVEKLTQDNSTLREVAAGIPH